MISSDLLKHLGGYIGGRWLTAPSAGTFEVIDPATGDILAVVPDRRGVETEVAIEATASALEKASPPDTRRPRRTTRI